jgi:hypothetical protein
MIPLLSRPFCPATPLNVMAVLGAAIHAFRRNSVPREHPH